MKIASYFPSHESRPNWQSRNCLVLGSKIGLKGKTLGSASAFGTYEELKFQFYVQEDSKLISELNI